MSDFLKVSGLEKRYGTGAPVISGMNHVFGQGTATGLVGMNGSGKTTFLRLMSVTAFPTSGDILFHGQSIYERPHTFLRHIGMVTDATDLPAYLSASELLEWTLRARKLWNPETSATEVDRILDELHFDERRSNLIGTYSSGMLQKAMLACSLVTRPALILLDEPFRALDVQSTEAAIGLLTDYKSAGGTLLVSSHIKDTLEPLCDGYVSFPVRE